MIKILGTGLPVIGYAKIGQSSPKESRLRGAPERYDHIELTGRERDSIGRLVPDLPLMKQLVESEEIPTCGGCERSKELGFPGGLPRRLPIYLPYNKLDLNLPNRLALYRSGTAFCVGDGEKGQRLKVITEARGDGQPAVFGPPEPFGPCGPGCLDFEGGRCKPNAKLQFILATQKNVGGVFQFKTTSWNSIRNLIGSLEMIQTATGGMLQWIPLFFDVSPQTVQPKGGGRANIAYIARVTFPGTPQQLLETVRDTLQLRAPLMAEIRQLEASIERGVDWKEPPEEAADVEAEFYPEETAPAARAARTEERQGGSTVGAPARHQAEPEDAELVNEPTPEAPPPAATAAKITKPAQTSWADQAF